MTVALSVAALPVTAVAGTPALGVSASAAGLLTAAYGLGNLAGSAGVMIRPPRTEADRLTTRLAAAIAAALLLITLAPSFPLAIAAYAAAGIANAYFFAAALAARSEYAPGDARGQIFVRVGALKITAGSAGTAAAGALVSASLLPLLLGTALTLAATLLSPAERHRRRTPTPTSHRPNPRGPRPSAGTRPGLRDPRAARRPDGLGFSRPGGRVGRGQERRPPNAPLLTGEEGLLCCLRHIAQPLPETHQGAADWRYRSPRAACCSPRGGGRTSGPSGRRRDDTSPARGTAVGTRPSTPVSG
ncbi:MFS transporter [Streptomyces roseolus]|uniref:MFS transporter n=1 Tax=Streptomyces roseolus TaxID=67358 RepID=UPI0037BD68F7